MILQQSLSETPLDMAKPEILSRTAQDTAAFTRLKPCGEITQYLLDLR